ncbi:DUF1572 family protein [Winogradskyella endarachnes]|uniref:DUF1572 domain-containing protein n=1 Tax=Winogradskyella endarachnes TaxID=2681965 RepID=A0A6L6UCH8_9FLAO|nr:DUF1572 family protein [Winogradskyella endarachnes]MUU78607.1 DUF1572 domain-containing protein [Winogradskyella endarachnes]
MKQAQQIASRIKEVFLNGTWIANTNYKNELVNLDYEIANKKIDTLNSISVLAQHIHYYVAGILNVYINNTLEIRDKFSFDFPPIDSQQAWDAFLTRFWQDTQVLITYIEDMSDKDLNQEFVDEKYGTYTRNLNGMLEHSYYHLGQIVLIKKLIAKL